MAAGKMILAYKAPKRNVTYYSKKRRSRRKGRNNPRLPLGGNGQSKMVRLRYATEFTLDAGAGTVASHVFRANGMFDPDVTLTGHQPQGFDQQMLYYSHFKVVGARINAAYIPTATASSVPSYVGIILSADGTSAVNYGSVSALLESRLLGDKKPIILGGLNSGYGTKQPNVTKYYSSKKFHRNQRTSGTLVGSAAADPTEQAFFEVFSASAGGNNPANINILVFVDYIAILSEPRMLTSS